MNRDPDFWYYEFEKLQNRINQLEELHVPMNQTEESVCSECTTQTWPCYTYQTIKDVLL